MISYGPKEPDRCRKRGQSVSIARITIDDRQTNRNQNSQNKMARCISSGDQCRFSLARFWFLNFIQSFLQSPDSFRKFSQLLEHSDGSPKSADFKRRRADQYFSRRNIVRNAALGIENRVVPDGDVTADAHLTRQDHSVADARTAGQADLGAE